MTLKWASRYRPGQSKCERIAGGYLGWLGGLEPIAPTRSHFTRLTLDPCWCGRRCDPTCLPWQHQRQPHMQGVESTLNRVSGEIEGFS
jgi:hypothetical protein